MCMPEPDRFPYLDGKIRLARTSSAVLALIQ